MEEDFADFGLSEPTIPFTQYLLPDGRQRQEYAPCTKEQEKLAQQIIDAGYRFEAEILTTGQVSLTIVDDEADQAIEISRNGPEIKQALSNLLEKGKRLL